MKKLIALLLALVMVFALVACGGTTGDPHLGDYAWPMMNTAFISMVDEPVASEFLAALRALDEANPKMGLRAFWWEIGGTF